MDEVDAEGPASPPDGADADAGADTTLADVEAASEALRAAIDGLDSAAAAAAAGGSKKPKKQQPSRPPLGSSGMAPFVAAAKELRRAEGGGKPLNRSLLGGCLEAIEQEAAEMRRALAQRQLASALGGSAAAAAAGGSDSDDPSDPYARPARQLLEDLSRARQRAEQDKAAARDTATADVLSAWLPLLDSFDAALAAQEAQEARAGPPPEGEANIHAAYRALHRQLLEILKLRGVTVLAAEQEGRLFDPGEHEAVMRQPAPPGVADGSVLKVLRAGYRVGERLVRPALVIVAYEE